LNIIHNILNRSDTEEEEKSRFGYNKQCKYKHKAN